MTELVNITAFYVKRCKALAKRYKGFRGFVSNRQVKISSVHPQERRSKRLLVYKGCQDIRRISQNMDTSGLKRAAMEIETPIRF